jgi:hypothetical protein
MGKNEMWEAFVSVCMPYMQTFFLILRVEYKKLKLHGLSPRATYTDRATAACRRSDCQLVLIEGATWSAVTDPFGRILGFLDRSRYFSNK